MGFSQMFVIFLLLGVAHGVFLAILLLTRRENAAANRILAGTMLAFAVYLIESALYADGHFHSFPHLIGISEPVIFLFGPAIYLYACTVSYGPEILTRRSHLHFVPAVGFVVYLLPIYLMSGPEKIGFVENYMRNGPPLDLQITEWAKLLHGTIYTLITFGVLRGYRRRLEQNFSTLDRINLGWLRNVLIWIMVAWIAAIASNFMDLLGIPILDIEASPTSLVLVVVVYLIGMMGLRQPEVFWPKLAGSAVGRVVPKAEAEGDESTEDDPKYRKSGLEQGRAAEIEKSLLAVMSGQKPQEDSGLTLQDLADRLSISSHNLSEVINGRMGTSFHDFVNGYRVDEAKRRFLDPKLSHQTILAIALDSGFRSKSTFNKIFKRFTGETPSAYRKDNASD